ncbi:hypothetical protein R3P38DRAFT_3383539 [Favolaschia claudopus]|uniref:Nucleolar protein 58 n=1 Tax=Favolaschia claudopus TaxID=2862362 RepID=A0AAW0E7B6_9AGAR
MLVLYETAMGYCLFKVGDPAKVESEDLWKEFESPEKASKLLKLKAIHRFHSTATAVEDITALQSGKLGKGLKDFLTEEVVNKGKGKESLVVIDPHLSRAISKKLSINVSALEEKQQDLWRGIRSQLTALLNGVDPKDLATMSLGLSHSLSRFKLKFSPDKVDTMIVQAIALLDDLDKEINIYAMRVKEWYGWHFPEMAKIIVDNIAYAKVIRAMGFRTNASSTSFAAILPEDLEEILKAAAEISMGTEISDSDITHIHSLCDQVISISTYRTQLAEYLRNRMNAIAPNLTALVGELVGARLISHAGSLLSLAKHPASTVQILGAEKALFRALKTKHDTPKYGLIYHASLIGQAPPKLKGKMARMVATKAALSIRVDALTDLDGKSEPTSSSIGIENRAKLESRLRALEHQGDLAGARRFADGGKKQSKFEMEGDTKTYNTQADAVDLVSTQREGPIDAQAIAMQVVLDVKEEKRRAKEEKRAKKRAKEEKAADGGDVSMDVDGEEETKKEKKEKKRKRRESEAVNGETQDVEMKTEETEEERKARKQAKKAEKAAAQASGGTDSPKKKKKKKSEDYGVGLGICRRLLHQLCLSNPPDSWPQRWASPSTDSRGSEDALSCDGLTLIMACRSTQRAEAARKELYHELDAYVAELRTKPDYDGHADVFRRNLTIEVEYLDLAVLSSVFDFSTRISKRYSYISHLILNAGFAPFAHIHWPTCLKQVAWNVLDAITRPRFYAQTAGEISADGLGYVWQSNFFGHYVLVRSLEPLLKNSEYSADSRVIWSSSLEASPEHWDSEDWQLIKTEHSYENVKYQIDLVGSILDRRALEDISSAKRVRHFVSHPAVTSTKIANNLVAHGGMLDQLKVFLFYMGRILLGSRNHPITTANGSIAAVHLALVSLTYITFYTFTPSKPVANGSGKPHANGNGSAAKADTNGGPSSELNPVRFGAETTRWGRAEVGLTPVDKWKEYRVEGELFLQKCDKLFGEISQKH